jgi:hypothetical protein
MNNTHRSVTLAGVLAFVCLGCATTHPSRDIDDSRGALLAAITHIERHLSSREPDVPRTPLTLVVSSATPETLRQACSALLPTVYDFNLPDTGTFALPSRHLQPQSLVITGATAVFKGLLGPVPLAGTPAGRDACGRTYQLRLLRQSDGSWRCIEESVEVCHLLLPRVPSSAA